MPEYEATTRPYELRFDEDNFGRMGGGGYQLIDYDVETETRNPSPIYIEARSQEGFEAARKRAELIVTAVNAHDDMLAALKAVEWLAGPIPYSLAAPYSCPDCHNVEKTDGRHKEGCKLAAAIAKGEAK